jgi:hypothetical protein
VSYSTQHPFSLIALLIMSTESEATSSAQKVPVKRRETPLRSPCTKIAVSRHHWLRRRMRMLESWKEKDLLRSSDDASHVGAETSEETSTSKSTKTSDKTASTSSIMSKQKRQKRHRHTSLSNGPLDDSTIIDHKIKAAGTGTSIGEMLLPESIHLNGRCFLMPYQSG